jgi:hypothetical protein
MNIEREAVIVYPKGGTASQLAAHLAALGYEVEETTVHD